MFTGEHLLLGGAAVTKLKRIANAGNADAMADLGACYHHGNGVRLDAAEAVRWYTRATEARNPPVLACNNLAICYKRGDGVRKNLSEAARLFRIAAEMGNANAQYNVGVCLQQGEGVPYNPVEAFTWFKRAADAGFALAYTNVGYALLYGLGVPQDKAAAIVYYRRGADQGDATSMFNLGVCYLEGNGLRTDVPLAVAWMTRARESGFPHAERRLAEVSSTLTPAQRAEVDQLLTTSLPRPPAPIAPAPTGGVGVPPPTRADVLTMGTGALKRLLQGRGVDTTGMLEKSELVGLALAAIGAAPR